MELYINASEKERLIKTMSDDLSEAGFQKAMVINQCCMALSYDKVIVTGLETQLISSYQKKGI